MKATTIEQKIHRFAILGSTLVLGLAIGFSSHAAVWQGSEITILSSLSFESFSDEGNEEGTSDSDTSSEDSDTSSEDNGSQTDNQESSPLFGPTESPGTYECIERCDEPGQISISDSGPTAVPLPATLPLFGLGLLGLLGIGWIRRSANGRV